MTSIGASSSSSSPFHRSSAVPARVLPAHGGAEEAEADRLADDDAELVRRELRLRPLLHSERREAHRGDRRLDAGDGRHGALDADVVGARRPAADAEPLAAAREAVRRSAARDGEIEVGPFEHADTRRPVGRQPRVERGDEPIAERRPLHHAAVEEERRRCKGALPLAFGAGKPSSLRVAPAWRARNAARCRVTAASEAYGRPSWVRAPRARAAGRALASTSGKKPSTRVVVTSSRVSSARRPPPRSFEPRDAIAIGAADELRVGEKPLLGDPARVRERDHLPAVDFLSVRLELLADHVREREVHVVAAEQDVVAHRDARELERAVAVQHGDGGEVGRPAADVDHEDDVPRFHERAPGLAHRVDPGVERRLRLLEQRHLLDAGRERRLDRELARARVERGRDREDDLLRPQRERPVPLRHLRFPGLGQVLEVAPRRFDRRDLLDVLGRAEGQDRRAPVDAGMREPALRARDEPRGGLDAARARVLADRDTSVSRPTAAPAAPRSRARSRETRARGGDASTAPGATS